MLVYQRVIFCGFKPPVRYYALQNQQTRMGKVEHGGREVHLFQRGLLGMTSGSRAVFFCNGTLSVKVALYKNSLLWLSELHSPQSNPICCPQKAVILWFWIFDILELGRFKWCTFWPWTHDFPHRFGMVFGPPAAKLEPCSGASRGAECCNEVVRKDEIRRLRLSVSMLFEEIFLVYKCGNDPQ